MSGPKLVEDLRLAGGGSCWTSGLMAEYGFRVTFRRILDGVGSQSDSSGVILDYWLVF